MAARTDELKTAVREALEARGVMRDLKSQIRAEVFKTLEHQQAVEGKKRRGAPPEENLVINRLIKDYLEFNGYCHTCSVFDAEAGSEEEELSIDFIAQEMCLQSHHTTSMPLLYQMIAHFRNNKGKTTKPHPPINDSTTSRPLTTTHSPTSGYRSNDRQDTTSSRHSNDCQTATSSKSDSGCLRPIMIEGLNNSKK